MCFYFWWLKVINMLCIFCAFQHLPEYMYLLFLLFLSDRGQVISVYSAYYGRRDQTTCATGRPASQVKTVTCSKYIGKVAQRWSVPLFDVKQPYTFIFSQMTPIIKPVFTYITLVHSCNGKTSCAVKVRGSSFGDPCFGTYKYLEVTYTCQCK